MSATDDAYAALDMFFSVLLGGLLPEFSETNDKGFAAAMTLKGRDGTDGVPLTTLRDMVQTSAAKRAAVIADLEARIAACDSTPTRAQNKGIQVSFNRATGYAAGLREALRLIRGEP